MPRALRIEYPGAIYQVRNRGDHREPVFRDDFDRRQFLKTLGETCRQTDWQVHADCLMNNHFHRVLETSEANLVAGMRWFLSTCTARFNRRHKLFGPWFSGRYQALMVEGSGNGCLQTGCEHGPLNPVRAKLLRADQPLREYAWSRWPQYLKVPEERELWLRVDRLPGEMRLPAGRVAGRAERENDWERCREGEPGAELKPNRRGGCLGPETFRPELLEPARTRAGESRVAKLKIQPEEQNEFNLLWCQD